MVFIHGVRSIVSFDLRAYTLFEHQQITSISKLENQGYCNINHLAVTTTNHYLIREFKMNLDREFEFRAQKKAHKKGLAPSPILLDKKQNIMITEFSKGSHKTLLNKKELRQLALILKKLHKIKIRKKNHNHKKDFKLKHKKAHATLLRLKPYKKELVFTHHDLNPNNILFSNKITLIDWEYAGVNDRYFDLATICVEFKLNAEMQNFFLRNYFGKNFQPNLKKLTLYKTLYKELWKAWMGEHR